MKNAGEKIKNPKMLTLDPTAVSPALPPPPLPTASPIVVTTSRSWSRTSRRHGDKAWEEGEGLMSKRR
uniref:Uncharacterized protein n=1 Tax=Oryza sativa subsp. japonica TaxID=39947 RepID=Q6H406_ORYSJ|nr:hypothetical protein [Oryza sativa Japonica Group]